MSTPRPPVLDDRTVEQLLTGRPGPVESDLRQLLSVLRSTGSGPAPRPSAALAELLDTGFEPQVVPPTRPAARRPWVLQATAGLTAAAASLLVAGTAQALPAPLQNGLGDLVRTITPFELPGARSADDPSSPEPERGSGTPTEQSVPTPASAARDGAAPVPGPRAASSAADARPSTGRESAAPDTGSPARTTVPDAPRAAVPEHAGSEPRREVPERSPAQREVGPPTSPRTSTEPTVPEDMGKGRAAGPSAAPADVSAGRR